MFVLSERPPIESFSHVDPPSLPSHNKDTSLTNGLLLLVTLVILSLGIGTVLPRINRALNPPLVATCIGSLAGAILYLSGTHQSYLLHNIVKFNEQVFFNFILPPIIFASGFELRGDRGKLFFYRFGTILWFALFATLVAFLLNAGGFYLVGIMKVSVTLSLSQAMALGALLSPTDPVTVLALFRDMNVDPVIETVVSGESLLNDAVAVLLYKTIAKNPDDVSGMAGTLIFGYQFFISMVIGSVTGLVIALVTKISDIKWSENSHAMETAIILLAPWTSYLLAEACDLSGVVACLFCGITLARYGVPNFSDRGGNIASSLYAAFSTLAETLVFVLLGMSVFSFKTLWKPVMERSQIVDPYDGWVSEIVRSVSLTRIIAMHLFTLIYVSLGRLISIAFTASIVNLLLKSASCGRLPRRLQYVVSLSGLRGAMAVALALKAQADLGGASGSAIVSTTLVYTLFTIVIVGPCLPRAFEKLCADEPLQPNPSIRSKPSRGRHLLIWRFLVKAVANMDNWLYAVVTERGRDGAFFGDRLFVWTQPEFLSSDDEEEDEETAELEESGVFEKQSEATRSTGVV